MDRDGKFLSARSNIGCCRKNKKLVNEAVLHDLQEIRSKQASELRRFRNENFSEQQIGRRLLFLFQLDLLPGVQGRILEAKANRDQQKRSSVEWSTKIAVWLIVGLMDIGMLFFIFLFALTQDYHRQNAWFLSFVMWLVVEVCLSSTNTVIVTHMVIPTIIMKDINVIKKRLVDNIRDYQSSLTADSKKKRKKEEETNKFNAADYLFVSNRLAKSYPDMKESQIITMFSTPWPRVSYQRVHDETKGYNQSFKAFKRAAVTVLVLILSNLVTIPTSVQDVFTDLVVNVVLFYIILFHIQLYEIFPLFAFLPLILLLVVIHFGFRACRGAHRERHVRLEAGRRSIEEECDPESTVKVHSVDGTMVKGRRDSVELTNLSGAIAPEGYRKKSMVDTDKALRQVASFLAQKLEHENDVPVLNDIDPISNVNADETKSEGSDTDNGAQAKRKGAADLDLPKPDVDDYGFQRINDKYWSNQGRFRKSNDSITSDVSAYSVPDDMGYPSEKIAQMENPSRHVPIRIDSKPVPNTVIDKVRQIEQKIGPSFTDIDRQTLDDTRAPSDDFESEKIRSPDLLEGRGRGSLRFNKEILLRASSFQSLTSAGSRPITPLSVEKKRRQDALKAHSVIPGDVPSPSSIGSLGSKGDAEDNDYGSSAPVPLLKIPSKKKIKAKSKDVAIKEECEPQEKLKSTEEVPAHGSKAEKSSTDVAEKATTHEENRPFGPSRTSFLQKSVAVAESPDREKLVSGTDTEYLAAPNVTRRASLKNAPTAFADVTSPKPMPSSYVLPGPSLTTSKKLRDRIVSKTPRAENSDFEMENSDDEEPMQSSRPVEDDDDVVIAEDGPRIQAKTGATTIFKRGGIVPPKKLNVKNDDVDVDNTEVSIQASTGATTIFGRKKPAESADPGSIPPAVTDTKIEDASTLERATAQKKQTDDVMESNIDDYNGDGENRN